MSALAFRDAYDSFPSAFLAVHPGYSSIRPALQPLVLTRAAADLLIAATRHCLAALRALSTTETPGYSPAERRWLDQWLTPGNIELATLFARADFVLGHDGPRMVEMNVSPTIGGIGILDRYAEVFATTAAHLAGRSQSMPAPAAPWSRTLRRAAGVATDAPLRVALVVADDETAVPHPHEAARFLLREGIDAEVVTSADVRFDGDRALVRGRSADVVYGCYTYDQVAEPHCRDFIEQALACRSRGGPLYVAPPAFAFYGNKAALARLTPADAAAALLPATRLLSASRCPAAEERHRLVLKPAIGLGGAGVVIGAHCTASVWQRAVDAALAGPDVFVVQEYVPSRPVTMPVASGTAPFDVSVGCLLFGGEPAGFLVRHASAGGTRAINCKQGATFAAALVEER